MRNIITLLVGVVVASLLHAAGPLPPLAIGYTGLPQQVTNSELAPGLEYFHIIRGQRSPYDYYTLSSGAITEKKADELIDQLRALGYKARKEPLAEFGLYGRPLGVAARVGRYATADQAKAVEKKLHRSGIPMAVRFSAEDGGPTSGPFDISILKVDLNRYRGKIISALATGKVSGKETTSSIAKRHDAIAAVNAGFFSWKEPVGTTGDPAGIAIVDGELVSEATDGRAALLIQNNGAVKVWVAHNVRTAISLELDQSRWPVHGLNRRPGLVLNCGNRGGEPVTVPAHDFVCTNDNEIVVFDRHFGTTSVAGEGLEFTINEAGRIGTVRAKLGGDIPARGYLVQAKGAMAERLRPLAKPGVAAGVRKTVHSDNGEITLQKGLYAVNGGPALIRNGQMDFAARAKEGWDTDFGAAQITDIFVDKKDRATVADQYADSRIGFYHGWVVRRHPRTAVGITDDNVLYVVVVYGRQPGLSAGASLTDMTAVLQSLGAVEAFNLDGGGSTAMVVNGRLTGSPSDNSGERAVGDALVFTVRSQK